MSVRTDRAGSRPAHHLTDELLVDYAAGALGEAESLVIATHLALCPACRTAVAALEDVGGALLEGLAPAELATGSLDTVLARIEGEAPAAPRAERKPPSGDRILVPEPLRGYLQASLEELPWKGLLPGLGMFEIATAGKTRKTRLLRVKAGTPMPEHTHRGSELTLVLAGGYSDERGHFVRGDIDITDDSVRHQPVADSDGDCFCLTTTEAPLKLTGRIGRLLNPFVRF